MPLMAFTVGGSSPSSGAALFREQKAVCLHQEEQRGSERQSQPSSQGFWAALRTGRANLLPQSCLPVSQVPSKLESKENTRSKYFQTPGYSSLGPWVRVS